MGLLSKAPQPGPLVAQTKNIREAIRKSWHSVCVSHVLWHMRGNYVNTKLAPRKPPGAKQPCIQKFTLLFKWFIIIIIKNKFFCFSLLNKFTINRNKFEFYSNMNISPIFMLYEYRADIHIY